MATLRKSVLTLDEEDLRLHSIWEFCSDEERVEGQDETTVRPSSITELQSEEPGSYILAADFVFASGSKSSGYVYSGRPNDFGCIQPNAVLKDRQINFYLGSLQFLDNPEALAAATLGAVGLTAAEVFPLTFTTRANIKGKTLTGIIPGFIARHNNGQFVAIT